MAVLRMKVLDKQEEDLIHDASLRNLQDMGILVRSQPVLKMLDESGANVDYKSEVVKIPESMVKEALAKATKRFKICARDPKNDLEVPVENYPYISTDGLTVYAYDIDTHKKRNATREDLSNFAKLADALDPVSFFWPIVTVTDVPEFAHSSHEMWTSLKGCSMHVQGDCLNIADAKTQIELASLVVGGMEELKKRPIFSEIVCPVAPLSFEKGTVEAQVELSRAGIPVVSMSMSLSGMSSPVTFGGTIVNINTENLASLVITQFAAPGAPHVYSSESAPIDMMTGNMNYAAPEIPPISAAAGQMAKRYGRPCMVGGWGLAGSEPGMNMSFSEAASGLMTTICNTDLGPGMGGLDSAKGCSLEQLVIDAYFWEDFRVFMKNIEITEESIALDVVKSVGHGNSFLTHPHTAKNFRKELSFWDKKRLSWQKTLSNDMVDEARVIAKKLLKEHEVEQIDRDIVEQGDKILKDYEKSMIP